MKDDDRVGRMTTTVTKTRRGRCRHCGSACVPGSFWCRTCYARPYISGSHRPRLTAGQLLDRLAAMLRHQPLDVPR